MAIQDAPLPSQHTPQLAVDRPIDIQIPHLNSQATDRFLAVQASFLDRYLTGNPVMENYQRYSQAIDKRAEVARLALDKAREDTRAVEEEFVLNPYGESGSVEQQAEAVSEALRVAQEQGADADQQFAEAISGPDSTQQQIDDEAARARMHKVLSDMEEELGAGDYIMDFMSGFVPGLSTYKGYQLTGNIFGQDDAIANAIRRFRSMSTEEQEKVFPTIVSDLKEKVGDVEAVSILSQFLQPLGGEDVEEFGDLETALDIVDVTGIGLLAGGFLKSVRQGYNTTKALERIGNHDEAVDSAVASLVDENVRIATNQDEVTALGNTVPFDTSIEDLGHQPGLSSEALQQLDEFFGQADATADDIILGRGFLKEGIVNTRERAELEAEAIAKLQSEKAENITRTGRDQNTTTFSYQIRDEDGNLTDKKFTMDLTLDDAGMFQQAESGIISQYLGSPTWFARGLGGDVQTAQRLDYLTARINKQLIDLTVKALKPIGLLPTPGNRRSLAKVDKALLEGDTWKNADGTRGILFKPEELRTRFNLEDNEVQAYYRLNRMYNNLWRIRNHEVRQEKVALGMRNVNFRRTEEQSMGKPFENATTAHGSLRTNNINYIYDADADEVVDIAQSGERFFARAYENDKVIVRLDKSYDIGENRGNMRYVMVNRDDVTDLPDIVLQRKVGYVPRIYEGNVYFVKELSERTVDLDKTENFERTLRFFDNKKEADEYIEQLVQQDVRRALDNATGDTDLNKLRQQVEERARKKYQRRGDREREILAGQAGDVGHGSDGLYTGARAQDDILFGLNGDEARRVNSFEALTRNVGNLSRFVSINQWRLGLEQRWINTAKEIFKAKGIKADVNQFKRLESIGEAVDEVRFLNRMYDQIRDWQNFPTESERFFAKITQNLYDAAKAGGFNRTAKILGNFRDADPISAARATAFHSLLGWFNPAQFWIQAQGMSIAVSLGAGKYLTRALRGQIGLTMLGEGAVDATRIARSAKAAGLSSAEMNKMLDMWRKTGYQDSVLQTADHAAAAKGYGMTLGAIKATADKGLMFYRHGELFNRRLSFTTAIERWKEKTGRQLLDITDDDLRNIMDDANNMMLNMTRANRALWQKGLPSLPTQFKQVTTKFLETVTGLNKQFTAAERGRMLFGQLVLYGTAGVPVVGLGTMLAAEVFGMSQQDIEDNPGIVKFINDGFWGVTAHQIFGVDIELSSRGALLRGIGDFVDNWFVQESTITEKALGAFGFTAQNFMDSFVRGLRPFTVSHITDIDFSDVGNLLTSPVLDSISTWRNWEKAEFMYKMGELYNRRGRLVVRDDFDFMDALAQAIGFQRTEFTETFDLAELNRRQQEKVRRATDELLLLMNDFAVSHPDGDFTEEDMAELEQAKSWIMANLEPDQQLDVTQAIAQAYKSDSRRAIEINRFLNSHAESTAEGLGFWYNTALGNKIIRLGLETEE